MGLKFNHVSFSYDEKEVLHDITVSLPEKGFVVLIGQSGSGKTTLLSLLCHTLPLKKGTIEGNERERIAYVFQNSLLLDYLTVKENILLGLELIGEEVEEKRLDDLMESLDIRNLKERNVTDLSGGEKMRVSLARALILHRPILVLDEPTGQLDQKTTEEIYALLKVLSEEQLVFMVTHDEKGVRGLATEIYRLEEGRLRKEQTE